MPQWPAPRGRRHDDGPRCVPMLEPADAPDLSDGTDPEQLDLWPNECEGLCGV